MVGTRCKSKIAFRGFTLIELVVSMAIMSIILVSIGSAIMLASRAIPADDNPGDLVVSSAQLARDIAAELAQAIYVFEAGDHAVAFTVADRDADGSPERIRYAWSGNAGDPLTRQLNSDAAVTVIDHVNGFDLSYVTATLGETYPGGPVESGEQLLAKHDSSTSSSNEQVKSDQWWAQPFTASLPSNALNWSVTRALIKAQPQNSGQTVIVALTDADSSNAPIEPIHDSAELDTSSMVSSTWQWYQVKYDYAALFAPGQMLNLAVASTSSNPSIKLGFINNTAPSWGPWKNSSNSGATWETNDNEGMHFYAYGTVTTPGPDQTVYRNYMSRIDIALDVDDAGMPIDIGASLLNHPQVVSAVWRVDFDHDPTDLDYDGDGSADWVCADGAAFGAGSLSNGRWAVDSTLETRPYNDFAELTTAEVCFRNTSIGGDGAVVWINADFSGSTGAPIFATLQLQSDNTQTLTLYRKASASVPQVLTTVQSLPADWITMRLLIDPTNDFVNLKLNGVDFGTYAYHRYGLSGNDRVMRMYTSGSSAEFDWAQIVVGGR